jgi:hypothetical protein
MAMKWPSSFQTLAFTVTVAHHAGELRAVGPHATYVAVEECVDYRLARDAERAQRVQTETLPPQRLPGRSAADCGHRTTGSALPAGAGSAAAPRYRGIRSGRSTDADGLTLVVQLTLVKPTLIAGTKAGPLWVIRR